MNGSYNQDEVIESFKDSQLECLMACQRNEICKQVAFHSLHDDLTANGVCFFLKKLSKKQLRKKNRKVAAPMVQVYTYLK